MDDLHPHLVVADLLQALLHSLGTALHVRLHDDVQLLALALSDLAEQVIQSGLLVAGELLLLGFLGALVGQFTGQALILHGLEQIAGGGHLGQAGDLHGGGGAGLVNAAALIVAHGTHTAHSGTGNDAVALAQGTVLHQNGGDGALALVQTGFHHGALGAAVGVGLQLLHFRHQIDVLQQLVNAHAGHGRNGHADHIAAPGFRNQLILGQLLHHALGVGGGLIHLVDGHNDGHIGSLGMVDGLNGLGHDAVVGSHHQNRNVGHVRAAGTHAGERLMARGIQEGDGLAVHTDLVRADVLGDAAGLALGHMGLADGVQNAGLAVVNVAHNHHNRGTLHQISLVVLFHLEQTLLDGNMDLMLDLGVEFFGHQSGGVKIHHVVHGVHLAHHHKLLDDLGGALLQAGGQLAHGDLIGDHHLQLGLAGLLQLDALQLLGFGLTAALEGLVLLVPVVELLLVAGWRGLAAVLHGLGGGQLGVALVVLIQVGVAGAGVHGHGHLLALDLHGLGAGLARLEGGLRLTAALAGVLRLLMLGLLGSLRCSLGKAGSLLGSGLLSGRFFGSGFLGGGLFRSGLFGGSLLGSSLGGGFGGRFFSRSLLGGGLFRSSLLGGGALRHFLGVLGHLLAALLAVGQLHDGTVGAAQHSGRLHFLLRFFLLHRGSLLLGGRGGGLLGGLGGCLLLRLDGGRLLLALKIGGQVLLLSALGQLIHHQVQLFFAQVCAGLLGLAGHGGQLVDHLLGRLAQVPGQVTHFILNQQIVRHSLFPPSLYEAGRSGAFRTGGPGFRP